MVRFACWLVRPRTLGMLFCAVLTLATLVAVFYGEERWRGKRAWESYKDRMASQGIKLAFEDHIPPSVGDGENFALTPFLSPLYDFLPGTQTRRDTNAFARFMERNASPLALATNLGFDLGNGKIGKWEKGERIDLMALLGTNLEAQAASLRKATVNMGRPTNQEQAATVILEIFRQTYDPVLDELRAASRRPHCRFNIKYDYAPLPGILLEHLGPIKGMVTKLSWRADAELALGRSQAAFDDLMLGLYLSDSVRDEPFLISHLVRIACHAIMTRVIWDGLAAHQWSEAQLQQLQAALARHDFLDDTQRVMRGERAGFGVRTIEQLMTPEGGAYLEDILGEQGQGRLIHLFMPRGWLYLEAINLSRGFEITMAPYEAWRAGRLDMKGFLAGLGQENEMFKDRHPLKVILQHRVFVGLLLPATGRVFEKSLLAQGRSDLAQGACALERYRLAHGQYPDALEALVPAFTAEVPADLMSGNALVYRRDSPQSYLLYSVGRNLADDGGQLAFNKSRSNKISSINYDQGDWVWPMPAP